MVHRRRHILVQFAGLLLAMLAIALVHGAPAQAAGSNGCGPNDWRGGLVPNSLPGQFSFKPACDRHDICYGTWGARKSTCDSNFYRDMMYLCAGRPFCPTWATAYYSAVYYRGQGAYNNAQRQAGLRRPLQVFLRSAPAAVSPNRIAGFVWTYSNGVASSTTCWLDGRPTFPCSPAPMFFVGPGRHTAVFEAANLAGRFRTSYTWTVR
jgi:hypothetical protein